MDTLERMTPEKFKEYHKGARPLAGDTKGAAYRLPREEALQKQFIQTSPKNSQNLLVIDIDDNEAELWLKTLIDDEEGPTLPEPNYITYNPFKGTAQVGFFITEGVGTKSGKDFLADVRKGLTDLAGGDPNYNNHKMRNPTYSAGQVTEWRTSKRYTLAELKTFIEPKPKGWYRPKNPVNTENSRHLELFDQLRQWSYREWRKPEFETRIMLEAQRINTEFDNPLPNSSLVTIIRSIEGFIRKHFSEKKFRERQSALGKRSGQVRAAKSQVTKQFILDHLEAGFSAKEIAELRGKSLDSTYKLIREAKKSVTQPTDDDK